MPEPQEQLLKRASNIIGPGQQVQYTRSFDVSLVRPEPRLPDPLCGVQPDMPA